MKPSVVNSEASRPTWARLGAISPMHLEGARLVVHHAVQLLASFGQTLVEPRPDDSHRSLDWHEGQRAFLSQPAADGLQAAVRVAELSLELRRGAEVLASLDLNGRTVQQARTWLGAAVGEARGSAAPTGATAGAATTAGAPVTLEWPEYEIPPRPEGDAAPLGADTTALEELARWYQDTFAVLAPLAAAADEASVVRCWPHHFDMATLLTFPGPGGSERDTESGKDDDARYVGIGMSPGDGGYDAPYFYVNGWPAPDPAALPTLDAPGAWHTDGWVGAVLQAADVVAVDSADGQRERVQAFLRQAGAAMKRAVLG